MGALCVYLICVEYQERWAADVDMSNEYEDHSPILLNYSGLP